MEGVSNGVVGQSEAVVAIIYGAESSSPALPPYKETVKATAGCADEETNFQS